MVDLYKVLGISNLATPEEIKKAYRSLAKKYHPDTNAGDREAEIKFKEITEAYEILSNELKRKKYEEERDKDRSFESNTKSERSDGKRNTQRNTNPSEMDALKEFEKFFGFNPKTKESGGQQDAKRPFDTTGVFQNYFNPKKNK